MPGMNDVVLKVHPAAGGWWIDCDLPLEPTYFRSGARAEQVARTLAMHLRGAGRDVELAIRDRADHVVQVRHFRPI